MQIFTLPCCRSRVFTSTIIVMRSSESRNIRDPSLELQSQTCLHRPIDLKKQLRRRTSAKLDLERQLCKRNLRNAPRSKTTVLPRQSRARPLSVCQFGGPGRLQRTAGILSSSFLPKQPSSGGRCRHLHSNCALRKMCLQASKGCYGNHGHEMSPAITPWFAPDPVPPYPDRASLKGFLMKR